MIQRWDKNDPEIRSPVSRYTPFYMNTLETQRDTYISTLPREVYSQGKYTLYTDTPEIGHTSIDIALFSMDISLPHTGNMDIPL